MIKEFYEILISALIPSGVKSFFRWPRKHRIHTNEMSNNRNQNANIYEMIIPNPEANTKKDEMNYIENAETSTDTEKCC